MNNPEYITTVVERRFKFKNIATVQQFAEALESIAAKLNGVAKYRVKSIEVFNLDCLDVVIETFEQ